MSKAKPKSEAVTNKQLRKASEARLLADLAALQAWKVRSQAELDEIDRLLTPPKP